MNINRNQILFGSIRTFQCVMIYILFKKHLLFNKKNQRRYAKKGSPRNTFNIGIELPIPQKRLHNVFAQCLKQIHGSHSGASSTQFESHGMTFNINVTSIDQLFTEWARNRIHGMDLNYIGHIPQKTQDHYFTIFGIWAFQGTWPT